VVIVMGGMAVMIGGKLVGEKAGPGGDQGQWPFWRSSKVESERNFKIHEED
jgi:hypothetical protein